MMTPPRRRALAHSSCHWELHEWKSEEAPAPVDGGGAANQAAADTLTLVEKAPLGEVPRSRDPHPNLRELAQTIARERQASGPSSVSECMRPPESAGGLMARLRGLFREIYSDSEILRFERELRLCVDMLPAGELFTQYFCGDDAARARAAGVLFLVCGEAIDGFVTWSSKARDRGVHTAMVCAARGEMIRRLVGPIDDLKQIQRRIRMMFMSAHADRDPAVGEDDARIRWRQMRATMSRLGVHLHQVVAAPELFDMPAPASKLKCAGEALCSDGMACVISGLGLAVGVVSANGLIHREGHSLPTQVASAGAVAVGVTVIVGGGIAAQRRKRQAANFSSFAATTDRKKLQRLCRDAKDLMTKLALSPYVENSNFDQLVAIDRAASEARLWLPPALLSHSDALQVRVKTILAVCLDNTLKRIRKQLVAQEISPRRAIEFVQENGRWMALNPSACTNLMLFAGRQSDALRERT